LIELKSFEKTNFDYESILVEEEEEEEIPLTEQIKTPPPPPPPVQAPTEIEIVKDEEEVEETIIESTETNNDEIIEVDDVEIEEEEEIINVPFAIIEDLPVFPGCEGVSKKEMGIQGRVYVNFIISQDGSITQIKMRGPDQNLEAEAKRIISLLPAMTPGKQRGRPVRVPFSIPIVFRLQ